MKRYVSAVLINALLFQFVGCYSNSTYSVLTDKEINAGKQYPGESLIFVLNDGSEVSYDYAVITNPNELFKTYSEYYYLKIDKPTRILIGKGDNINEKNGNLRSFEGVVQGDMIDSSRNFILNNEEYCVYWTKDNNRLSFKAGNYLEILPEQGTGYFICKPYKLERIIHFEDIKEIKRENLETNWWVVGPLIAISVALFVGMLAIVKNAPSSNTFK